MASTGPPPPLQIYQDPILPSDRQQSSPLNAPLPTLAPLRPIHNTPADGPLNFAPPPAAPVEPSPLKNSHPSSSPPKVPLTKRPDVTIPPPIAPAFVTGSPQKRSASSTLPVSAVARPQQPLFTTFQTILPTDKENVHAAMLSGSGQGSKAPAKRPIQDVGHLRDRQPKRARVEEPVEMHIPDPADMPPVEDDGNKPPYSYAMLIGMSILRAPNRRLTLAHIYKWISDSFAYYRTVETGWQNSIRHNLSLNKAFVKRERPKDDPGKGNYWLIAPGCESHFLKEKQGRRPLPLGVAPAPLPPAPPSSVPAASDGRRPASHGRNENAPATAAASLNAAASAGQLAPRRQALVPPRTARDELSSDATISASDGAGRDHDPATDGVDPSPSSRLVQSSPPPPPPLAPRMIASSPPAAVSRRQTARDATPPSARRLPFPSSWSRKRKSRAMQDSGYFSSLDSSALRPNPMGALLTSEAELDRPRTNSGRAEEELARTRRTSNDSPSVLRSVLYPRGGGGPALPSSSPTRVVDNRLRLPPRTPATTFKVPIKPPPPLSASPNTNLRNHRNRIRQLVGSPGRHLGTLADELPWSPAFNLEDNQYGVGDGDEVEADTLANDFNIFSDSPVLDFTPRFSPTASPEKLCVVKRPRLDRARTSASILADITGHRTNVGASAGVTGGAALNATPLPKFPFLRSSLFSRSPSKSPTPRRRGSTALFSQENVFVGGLLVDDLVDLDDGGDDDCMDKKAIDNILSSVWETPSRGTSGAGYRPNLGRSSTTRY